MPTRPHRLSVARSVPERRAGAAATAPAADRSAGRADRHRKDDAALPLRRRPEQRAEQQPEPVPVPPARLVRRQVRARHRPVRARHVLRHASRGAHLLLARDDRVAAQRAPRRSRRRRGDDQGAVRAAAGRAVRRPARRPAPAARLDGDDPPHGRLARRLVLGRGLYQDVRSRPRRSARRRKRSAARSIPTRASACTACAVTASAKDAGTFAATENIAGFPGDPIKFKDDGSWRTPAPAASGTVAADGRRAAARPRAREERAARVAVAGPDTGAHPALPRRAARHDARASQRPAAVPDLGPVHGLPRRGAGAAGARSRAVPAGDVADAAAVVLTAAVAAAGTGTASTCRSTASGAGRRWAWRAAIRCSSRSSRASRRSSTRFRTARSPAIIPRKRARRSSSKSSTRACAATA